MQDTWKWLAKAVGTTLTPRRLIMFGLVFLFAFRRGVVKIIQSHILPLSMDPSKKETIQQDGSSSKPNDDQEIAAHNIGTNSSKDEKTVSKKSGSDDEQRVFDLALTLSRDKAKPSITTQSSIILSENLPTQSHANKTTTESSEVNEKCRIDTKGDMPPKRKRRTSRDDTKSKKPKEDCKVRTLHSCNSADDDLSKPFSLRKCRSWFLEYAAQDDPETIGPDGIERLCHDLAVDPENVVMLVVAWKLQAEKLGFFKFTEWSKGMGNLECDSTAKLQARLGSLSTILRDNPTFKKIYRYAFDFCRNPDQRTLDIDTAMAMLRVLLKGKWSLIEHFLEFMQQSKYKVINRDQWCNVLEFSRSISTDLSNYDEDGAWPVLMDEFVEWYRTNYQNTTETST